MNDLPTVTVEPKRYLVTASDNYYPCSGQSDWVYHGPSLEEAKEVFASAKRRNHSAYLIDLFTGEELDSK